MKKIQYVHIVMLVVFFIGFLFSFYHALVNFKEMINYSKEDNGIASSLSVITQTKTPYPIETYQLLTSYINTTLPGVSVEIKTTGIYITSANIENEVNVRQTMTALLSLDRNLTIDSICGKSNGGCNGYGLEIVLKGEKNNAALTKKEVK